MPTPKKKVSFLDKDKHTLEFTPAQLVGAVCTLMLFGLVCFMLGVAVNKIDNARSARQHVAAAPTNAAAEDADSAEPAREGTQTTPRTNRTASAAVTETASAPPPRTVTVPPKRETLRSVPLPTASETPSATPAPPPAAPIAAPVEPVVEPPVQVAAVEPVVVEAEPAQSPPVSPPPSPDPSVAPVLNPSEDKFAIQVISFSANNRKQAEDFKALLERQTDLTARLVPSKDGAWLRVAVGSFADRASADKKRAELSQIQQFKDCFVLALQ